MAGITSTGFVSKRLPDVLDSLRNNAKNRFGSTVNVQPDSVLGQLFDTTAAEIATLWQTLEATYASRDPAVAEQVLLDTLVYLNGLSRKPKYAGTAVLTPADVGYPTFTTLPAGTIITEPNTGKRFSTNTDTTASLVSCTAFGFGSDGAYTPTLADEWSVTIDGFTITYTLLSGDGLAEAAAGLLAAVNAETLTTGWVAQVSIFGLFLFSLNDVPANISSSITGGYEEYIFVSTSVLCTALDFDNVTFPALTNFEVAGGFTNIPIALNITETSAGSEIESDVALRLRRQQSLSYAGTSTLDSIVAKVRSLNGVIATRGYENITNVADSYTRPAKSFEIVVQGGINSDIAKTIYDFKPAGIETTYGDNGVSNITLNIADENGTNHPIKFSKAYPTYLHTRVDFSVYDEERFLDTSANEIKKIVHDFSLSGEYQIGKDVIPQRFLGDIYANVQGIKNITMQVDTTANSGDTPAYSTDSTIAVGIREYVVLPLDNIRVCKKFDNTVSVTNASVTVTINAADTAKVAAGDTVYFGLETDDYIVDSVSGTTVRLTTTYAGATNASQTLVVRRDF